MKLNVNINAIKKGMFLAGLSLMCVSASGCTKKEQAENVSVVVDQKDDDNKLKVARATTTPIVETPRPMSKEENVTGGVSPKATATPAIKEVKISAKNLRIINAKLIDPSIKQKYYLVKIKKTLDKHDEKFGWCQYQEDKADRVCIVKKFESVDKNESVTFTFGEHYSNIYLKGDSYLSIKANINGKKYKKIYKLDSGTIDHNPENLRKLHKFNKTKIALKPNSKKKYYSAADISKLNEEVTQNKCKMLKK